jgi:prepilin-type N-terminal cleavage/methylation domain-containing protein/prepilin-type processing-associated H-X9-DG protein
MKKKNGFTLIELLVVVAIIAVLIAMLLPALSSARESARKVQCSANQRNIGVAIQQYIMAYNDYFPWACHEDTPFLKSSFMNLLREFGIFPKERHYVCPSDPTPYYGCKISDMGTPNVTGYYSYVYNSYCGQNTRYYQGNNYLLPKRLSNQSTPDRLVLLADGAVRGNWYWFDWLQSDNIAWSDNPIYPQIKYIRHGKNTINCLFADGRVENINYARAISYESYIIPEPRED